MCGSSEKSENKTVQTSNNYPAWTGPAGQDLFKQAMDYYSSNPTMPQYSGPRVADFGDGFGKANDFLSSNLGQTDPALTQAGGAFGSIVNSIDPNASTQSLMDPYVDATLQPTLRNINESLDRTQAASAAGATSAGALGDTGYAVEKAMNNRNATQAIGDATGAAYSKAFQNAQGQHNALIQQLLSGASGLDANQQQGFTQNNQMASELASLGATQQTAGQKGIDSSIADANKAADYPYKSAVSLASILSAIPKDTSGTSASQGTSSAPDNSGMGLAGAALSYIL